MKISQGKERLFFIVVFITFIFHIAACMFVFITEFDEWEGNWMYRTDYGYTLENYELYTFSIYFVVTTMSTVGYGDMSAGTRLERIFCIVLMILGVIFFNIISGALSSVISFSDSQHAVYQEKIIFLNKLRSSYNISHDLYIEIKRALLYDARSNYAGFDEFVDKLPINLKLEICEEIHRENFSQYPLFKQLGNKHFLAWVGSRFKPRLITESTYMYQRGDNIEDFFFSIKGMSGFVMPEHQNKLYAVIDPEEYKKNKSKRHRRRIVMQSFGIEDAIINSTAMIHDDLAKDDAFQFSRNGFKFLDKRFLTVQCVTNMEVLVLSYTDIERMKRDFKKPTEDFFKVMIKQT